MNIEPKGKTMNYPAIARAVTAAAFLALLVVRSATVSSDPVFFAGTGTPSPVLAQSPLFLRDSVPPLNMLVMGRDHKIYTEAYNDASDLNGDGALDIGYRGWELKSPAPTDGSSIYSIDYYGYFNSNACYSWDGSKFVPIVATANKQCTGKWSGDFLNYLTTSRMDALRRTLYGGWRQVDTATQTILQGAYFPQDAHSWGKEYQSVARDGYDISRYAPLTIPDAGNYNLFAVTTLKGNNNTYLTGYQAPILRVLKNTDKRVWNWLSIEGPVAGNKCFTATSQRVDCVGGGVSTHPGHPNDRAGFNGMETTWAKPAYLFGSQSLNNIDCNSNNCNPNDPQQDNYLSIISGTIKITQTNTYQFLVNGDDAFDFEINDSNGNSVATAGCYGSGGFRTCGGNEQTAIVSLIANKTYTYKFRQEDATGGDGYQLSYKACSKKNCNGGFSVIGNSGGADASLSNSTITTYNLAPVIGGAVRDDYDVRVLSCPSDTTLQDSTCKAYPNGQYKPTGILHDYGENQRMYFGLITGSQFNNLEGGVLRRNIKDFASEIDAQTGTFLPNVNGIVNTINRFRMIGGGYNNGVTDNTAGDTNWNWNNNGGNCPTPQISAPLSNGNCRMWGNPLAEMAYESLRYFAGAAAPTDRFSAATNGGNAEELTMGLGVETWKDPYKATADGGLGYPTCAKPRQTLISDINPSYDGDLPGSTFAGAVTTTNNTPASISGFNAATEGQAIWNAEFAGPRNIFIGEVNNVTDGAPTAKTASSFGNIRGLSPEEPTKNGSYYTASVARFGRLNDINAAGDVQNLSTYSIALASALPRIQFPVGNGKIELVPFGKTTSGTFGGGPRKNTNNIVHLYVEQIVNLPNQRFDSTVNGGRPFAVFRINYEDSEQGNDYDMDSIVRYLVQANSNGTVTVALSSDYAAGSADQNLGYVMSGTTQDGIYLDVRDSDSTAATFTPYALNTPNPLLPGACNGVTTGLCGQQLPLTSTRVFTPSTTGTTALRLNDPLWYAAKYGAPDPLQVDADGDGVPDNYFLVTNPLKLRGQLSKAFDKIANDTSDAGNAEVSGSRIASGSFTLQPSFARGRSNKDWTGDLQAKAVNSDGTLGSVLWSAQALLTPVTASSRNILTMLTPGVFSAKVARDFQPANLGATTTAQFATLGINEPQVPSRYGAAYTPTDIVSYLRGNMSREAGTGGTSNTLRARTAILGDIVNSEPAVFSPKANLGYGYYSDAMFSGYAGVGGYLDTKKTRTTAVLVGANDGMLHGFNGATIPCTANPKQTCAGPGAGSELFAFIPNGALSQLGNLPLPDALFKHKYYVDGQITIGDAKNGATWKSLAVGNLGAGGKSIYALDISDPTAVGTTQALWELNSTTDSDLGYMFGKPLLIPLENGSWGVVFGNGYGGSRSDPSLYIVDAFTGALIRKITANDGATGGTADPYNGLGQITAVDRDGDGKVDAVYGGDLLGNLWKYDLSNASSASWNVAFGGSPLFTATEGSRRTAYSGPNALLEVRQPITGGIRVSAGPGSGVMVFFGTGRYFLEGDNDIPTVYAPQVQSLYGVWDNGTAAGGRSNLVAQTITAETTTGGFTTRNISQNLVAYFGAGAKRGWLLDLAQDTDTSDPALDGVGERFIGTPRIQNGKILMATFTPQRDLCEPGGVNFLYALDLISGSGALANVAVLPSQTPACTDSNCGAIALNGGKGAPPVTGTGVVIPDPATVIPGLTCVPGTPGCTGGPGPTFEECQVVIYPGALVLPRPCGRQSWRQLK